MTRMIAAFLTVIAILAACSVVMAEVNFIIVDQGESNKEAARKLRTHLKANHVVLTAPDSLEYEEVISRLANWAEPGGYLAHMTPYAFVAAEMLGAQFEVLATTRGVSTKGKTTYSAYFVVDDQKFPRDRGIEHLPSYLRDFPDNFGRVPNFIYHSKFSTSSFFLPSVYLRSKRVFETMERLQKLISISVNEIDENSSSELVRKVARGEADLASVWDGTKAKFQEGSVVDNALGSKVRFLQLPTLLPNDLLVVSASLPKEEKDQIRRAIGKMEDDFIALADIHDWVDINEAPDTLGALSSLRRIALAPPAPVTVKVDVEGGNFGPQLTRDDVEEAARQAIRLSGTELVLYDEYYYRNPPDINWNLAPIHDGAIVIKSSIRNFGVDPQEFRISFSDNADLTRRLGSLIHSRMHRIRFVWPYDDKKPTIIRDFDFPVDEDAVFRAQKITWMDYDKHEFTGGTFFDTTVISSDFFKIRLDDQEFRRNESNMTFSAMSNEAFRVVVERPSIERPVFKAFTILFVLLLILAAAGAVFDVRRKGIRAAFQKIPVAGIDEEGRRLVKDYHRCWNNRKINDADIISCDRKRIEQYIEELKLEREVAFDKRRTIRKRKHIAAKLPIVGSWISGGGSYDDEIMVVSDAENVGNAHRLDDLITFLLKEKMLSAFNGTAIGWDAMNAMTKRSLGLPGAEDSSPDSKGNGRDIIRPDSSEVVERVSEYFERVLKDGEVHANLFSHAWEVNDGDPEYLLTKSVALPGEILIDGKAFKRLDLEVNLPKDEATESGIEPGNTFDLCLFGKLVHKNYSKDGVEPHLILHFQQMAVLRDVSDSI